MRFPHVLSSLFPHILSHISHTGALVWVALCCRAHPYTFTRPRPHMHHRPAHTHHSHIHTPPRPHAPAPPTPPWINRHTHKHAHTHTIDAHIHRHTDTNHSCAGRGTLAHAMHAVLVHSARAVRGRDICLRRVDDLVCHRAQGQCVASRVIFGVREREREREREEGHCVASCIKLCVDMNNVPIRAMCVFDQYSEFYL